MIDDVYNAKILGFAGNISRIGRLDAPDVSAKAHSKLCGSTVIVDLKVNGDVVVDYAHDVRACALGQASSAIVAANIIGATGAEMLQVQCQMREMLKDDGPPPKGRFADLKYLEPVKNHKARHASTLLVFDAVVDALAQIARGETAQDLSQGEEIATGEAAQDLSQVETSDLNQNTKEQA